MIPLMYMHIITHIKYEWEQCVTV